MIMSESEYKEKIELKLIAHNIESLGPDKKKTFLELLNQLSDEANKALEKSADEMFKELGYKKIRDGEDWARMGYLR